MENDDIVHNLPIMPINRDTYSVAYVKILHSSLQFTSLGGGRGATETLTVLHTVPLQFTGGGKRGGGEGRVGGKEGRQRHSQCFIC